uniref:Uncharacterized protein n=1 Tax=Anopheles atroparvus TaxID=41427 RepID=A0AAG5DEY7_ANOAO
MKFVVGLIVAFCSFSDRLSVYSISSDEDKFVKCDLDLDDPRILQQLPKECQNLDEATRILMLRETESFKQFHGKLLAYEASQGKDTESELYMDMDFRRELYAAAALHECQDNENSLEENVDCLVEKRARMIALIDSQS